MFGPRVMRVLSIGFWFTVAVGAGLILWSIPAYFLPGVDHPFIVEKDPISRQALWSVALHLHVAAGAVCLPVCIAMFSRRVLRAWPSAHRILGYVYALAILVLAPSGLYLAAYAKGGVLGSLGFSVSGILVFLATAAGVAAAIRRKHRVHRIWMIRSVAQVTSAVTFRLLHLGFDFAGLAYTENYLLSLWLSVLGNALVAELIIYARFRRATKELRHAVQS